MEPSWNELMRSWNQPIVENGQRHLEKDRTIFALNVELHKAYAKIAYLRQRIVELENNAPAGKRASAG